MSPAERIIFNRIQRRASELGKDLGSELLRAWARVRAEYSTQEFEELIHSGQIDKVADDLVESFERAVDKMRGTLHKGVGDSTNSFARDLPIRGRPDARPPIRFDILNPHVLEAVKRLDTRVMTTLKESIRETTRQHIESGLVDGINPRAIARSLRDVIGLAPNQEEAVRNFGRAIRGEEGAASPLSYKLRDKRFDATLKRIRAEGGELAQDHLDKMQAAYRRRFIAHNAETNARTAALDVQRLGQILATDSAIEKGLLDVDLLERTWRGTLDARERESHLKMEGETVPYDQPYSNGQMRPGEGEFNCRCFQLIRQKRAATVPVHLKAENDRARRVDELRMPAGF